MRTNAVRMVFRRVVACAAVGLLMGSLSIAVDSANERAEAHVQFHNGRWVFRGMTISSPDRKSRSDPLNIIFKGNNQSYTSGNVESHIKAHTGWTGTWPCSSKQRVVWQRVSGDATTSDKDDFQLDNRDALCNLSRWHLRAWDDHEHADYTNSHGPMDQWVVMNIHHENNSHDIDLDWDAARRQFIEKMAGHCSWPVWKRHPGARISTKVGQGFANTGRIGRISLKHTPNC